MAKHRGGRRRLHKVKGYQPIQKTYQSHVQAMRVTGQSNTANGSWVSVNVVSLRNRAIWG